jgi:TM2 domain-containing membrane protein YozV
MKCLNTLEYFNQREIASKLFIKKVFRNKLLCHNRCVAFCWLSTYLYVAIIDRRFWFYLESFEFDNLVYLFLSKVIINCYNLLLADQGMMVNQRNYLIVEATLPQLITSSSSLVCSFNLPKLLPVLDLFLVHLVNLNYHYWL